MSDYSWPLSRSAPLRRLPGHWFRSAALDWISDHPRVLIATVMAFTAFAQIAAYWPGILQVDATLQYDQAVSGHLNDWHAPVMTWLWTCLLRIWPGPAPMLLLQAGLYWAGFALLIKWALRQQRVGLAYALLACALMPLSVARLGSILKDCMMAGSLVLAFGLFAVQQQKSSLAIRLSAIGMVLFATAMRPNAFFATIPLLVALLPAAWRLTWPRLMAVSIVATLSLMLVTPVTNKIVNARSSEAVLSLIIFDLAGITTNSGENAFPAMDLADPVEASRKCYTPRWWDTFGWWTQPLCPINFHSVRAAFERSHESPYHAWLHAIARHPLAYAEHRLVHFNLNIRFLSLRRITQPVWNASKTHYAEFQKTPNLLLSAFNFAASRNAESPFGWPVLAMAVAAGVLIVTKYLRSRALVTPLALSALSYGLSYLPISVAADLRYHMWTTIAAAIAGVIALADINHERDAIPRRRLLLAALPVSIVLSLGILARWILTPGMVTLV